MRQTLSLALGLSLAFSAIPQNDAPKPTVSPDALTEERVAVYRAVLEDYSNGSNSPLNLADKTETLDFSETFPDKECLKGLDLESTGTAAKVVHRIDVRLTGNKKRIALVDADLQQTKIEENDPQKLMKRAIDEGEKVTEKQLDDSLKQAFGTGLFTFSEIVFDKKHQHAVLKYSFVCGGLCGHGNTMVIKKVGQKWKVGKRCGGWIS